MDKLIGALVKAQSEINHAARDATNPHFRSEYATLEAVIEAVKPALLKNEILYQQVSEFTENGICIETLFYGHGNSLSSGKVFVPADKNTPQGFGSALTYARRYSLSLACGIGSDADDDGNAAEKVTKVIAKPVAKKPPVTPAKPIKDAKYSIINAAQTTIASADDEDKYLELCRSFLKDPAKEQCIEMFKSNENTIRKASIAAVGETKSAYEKLLEVYEVKDA